MCSQKQGVTKHHIVNSGYFDRSLIMDLFLMYINFVLAGGLLIHKSNINECQSSAAEFIITCCLL